MKLLKKLLVISLVMAILINNFSPLLVLAVDLMEENKNQTVELDKVQAQGNIEVETHFVLPIRNSGNTNIDFSIYDENKVNSGTIHLDELKKNQDGIYETVVELKDKNGNLSQSVRSIVTKRSMDGNVITGDVETDNIVYYSINLYSLNVGKYTLELKGKNYVTYDLDVTLKDFSKRVTLTNETGMFAIGDVNGDNKVNKADEALMLEAIENNDLSYDLNLDKVVDIADLSYITANMNSKANSFKIENTGAILNTENVSLELNNTTSIAENSKIENLFIEGETVTLSSAETISETNPIELALDLGKDSNEAIEMSEIRIGVGETNKPKKIKLLVETKEGKTLEYLVDDTDQGATDIHLFTDEVGDSIKVDLGSQVAVKKVTIVITESSTNNLADIAKVEFLNNVKVETKEPDNFYTPQGIHIDDSVSEQLTVTFHDVPNVTGYEIRIVDPSGTAKEFQTTYTTFTIEDLKNYQTYKIYVQSANQEWRSGWSEAHEGTPKATRKPPKVDMVNATPTYSGIDFSWKKMDDTLYYNLYYRIEGTEVYTVVKELKDPKYAARGLEADTMYEAYVIGVNELGESDSYTLVKARTLEAGAAIVPKYNLINDGYDQDKHITTHIENVYWHTGTMTDNNDFAMVDDNFNTYWYHNDWTISANAAFNPGMPIIELDNVYEMDEFVLTVPDSYAATLKSGGYDEKNNDVKLHYWEEDHELYDNNGRKEVRAVLSQKTDSKGRKYYVLKLKDPIKAKAVAFGLTVAGNVRDIKIDEVKFYKYDSLVDDVAALFTDDLRLVLAEGVDQTKIDKLKERANAQDHGEYSPYRDSVLADLEYAEKILKDEALDDVITLDPNISNSYNGHVKFAMTISDYQPLGIAVRPDETINVYVGTNSKTVNAQIVFTQYHAEAGTWNATNSVALQKGLNIIKVPKIGSAETPERGGSVYVRYTSTPNAQTPIKIRVSGGTKIPVVDTTNLKTEQEKKAAIKKYVTELEEFNASLPQKYASEGKVFDKESSALGSTEIVTKYGLFSVSSVAVEDALKSGLTTVDQKTDRLYESMEAFDEMMELFYRQKGFVEVTEENKDTVAKTDVMPQARINIRYMQMFDGAFMYAGGYHVGIEYGSIAGLIQASRNSEDKTGYFGWGISHEVGHQINLRDTVFAEVTNNIYAMLAQTSNDHDLSRLESSKIYEKIYDKVTSHTIGRAQNVFVQLGMYWQLHLAYDENKTFEDTNSIYAKINRIARTYKNEKKFSRDDLTILYACMAAEKDLTDFFAAWGLIPSADLKEELASREYPKETRAIYYLNDKARRYTLANKSGISEGANILTASLVNADSESKRVTLKFNVNDADKDKILGYEILRNGVSIGFVEGDVNEFVDNIGAENNRAYTYTVVAYDYLLNKTNEVKLSEVKISHDGSVKKDNFTITSNVKEHGEDVDNEDENLDLTKLHVNNLIDGKNDTGFNGTEKIATLSQVNDKPQLSKDTGNAYVIINLNNSMSICGIKYRALIENGALAANTITKYKVSVSVDGEKWDVVRTGSFNLSVENPEETIYFMGQGMDSEDQLWTYNNIGYVKIESDGNTSGLSGAEIDVIAPPGDNVEIGDKETSDNAIGRLTSDYCYLTDGCPTDEGKIKSGSVVIRGSYRGNPSFNNVLIADADNEKKVYGSYFLIFATLNSDKSVYDVADGTWLYVLTKEEYERMIKETNSIRAYLYRVNDAETMAGQRLTSTSKAVSDLPDYNDLKPLTITDKR